MWVVWCLQYFIFNGLLCMILALRLFDTAFKLTGIFKKQARTQRRAWGNSIFFSSQLTSDFQSIHGIILTEEVGSL